MKKILCHTLTVNEADRVLTFRYYITETILNDYLYYGVQIESTKAMGSISGIFPYEHDAKEFADMLFKYRVTPLSFADAVAEHIIQKVVS